MRICAVFGCSSSTYQLKKWRSGLCQLHVDCYRGKCGCPEPFKLFPFPTKKGDAEARNKWIKAINRKDTKTGINWQPNDDDRVCSKHFVGGQPTVNMGYKQQQYQLQAKRAGPKVRSIQFSHVDKKPKIENEQSVIKRGCRDEIEAGRSEVKGDGLDSQLEVKENISDTKDYTQKWNCNFQHDHDYTFVCDCVEHCSCQGCSQKDEIIHKLRSELEELKTQTVGLQKKIAATKTNVVDKFLKTDAKIRTYTGLPNKRTFNDLVKYVTKKAKKLHYWSGSKKVISTKVRRNFKASPKKSGPKRKLSVKEELTLVLLKLRTAVTNEMLADLFGIGTGGASKVINTWVKFLAREN